MSKPNEGDTANLSILSRFHRLRRVSGMRSLSQSTIDSGNALCVPIAVRRLIALGARFFEEVVAGSMVVFAVGMCRRMMGLRG